MLKLDSIVDRVLRNCDISDSGHAGLFTVCGLALRLRDLYKWEKRVPAWEERESGQILEWIGEKEQAWDSMPDEKYGSISLRGDQYDPFDTKSINAVLEPEGFFYGAGYARSLKPTFFLAPIEEKRVIDGHTVYTLGRELARDLFTAPALTQDDSIVLRKESAMILLWNQILYMRQSGRPALNFALGRCGIRDSDSEALKEGLAAVFSAQEETYVYHEMGELHDVVFDRRLWREIISTYPHSPVELVARAIKDLLADTNPFGTISHIVRTRKAASIGFYVAFLDGLMKEFFPELRPSFQTFAETGDWGVIEQAANAAYGRAKEHAGAMTKIFGDGKQKGDKEWAGREIERRFLGERMEATPVDAMT